MNGSGSKMAWRAAPRPIPLLRNRPRVRSVGFDSVGSGPNREALFLEIAPMLVSGESGRNRTVDPFIKSEMLYRLSYGLTYALNKTRKGSLGYQRVAPSASAQL